MTDRERDAYIAEKLMGQKVVGTNDCNGEDNLWLSEDGQHVKSDKFGIDLELPFYSTDHADAFEMEEKIKERGMQEQYASELFDIVASPTDDPMSGGSDERLYFALAHATPAQRAQACYLMLELSKDADTK